MPADTIEVLTRIRSKYDTLTNWIAVQDSFTPLAGEICITAIPTSDSNTVGQVTKPAIMMKVGDGVTVFKDLPWTSALSADVYPWAKAATKPTYTASEVGAVPTSRTVNGKALSSNITLSAADVGAATSTDITNAINALDKTDSAQSGQYVSAVSQTDGVITVTRATLPTGVTYTFAEGSTNGAFTVTPSNGSAQSVPIHGLGSAAYTASSAYATAAQGALAASALQKADITSGSANGTISVDGTDVAVKGLGSAAYSATSAFATPSSVTSAVNTHNSSSTAHSDIRTLISELQGDVDDINSNLEGLTGALHWVGDSTTDPTGSSGPTIEDVSSFKSGDVCSYQTKEYIYNGTSWREFGDEGSHLTKTEASSTYVPLTRTVNGKALSANITLTASDVGAATTANITSAINALDKSDSAVSGQYVSAVSQTDGVITVTRAALPTYSNATTSAAGLMSATDKAKLDGIASGAQVNVIEKITVGGANQAISSKTVALGAAAGKAVDTSISAGTSSANLPTSAAVEARINAHAGIDKTGTVTSVSAGTGLKITGTASTTPTVGIDTATVFIFNCGSATENVA